jgi:hypothetical protein
MHEIAVVSGFAAAYKLGADYPFTHEEKCKRLFRLYLAASHGMRMVRVLWESVPIEMNNNSDHPWQREEVRAGFLR